MQHVYLLNLEYLQQIADYIPDSNDLTNRTIRAQLEPLTNQPQSQQQATLVVGTLLWECSDLEKNNALTALETINQVVSSLGAKFHLITTINYEIYFQNASFNFTCIDFFLLRTYQCCRDNQEVNLHWNYRNKKILFLMGKYHKAHRLGLLYELYHQGLLNDEKCIWSSYQKIPRDNAIKYLPRNVVNLDDVDDFLTRCYRTLDKIDVQLQEVESSHYSGFPFDVNLYKDTNLSLISETLMHGMPFVTEKTYRAIINRHPFVIAATSGQLKYLQNSGFCTFEKFMKFPDYDAIRGSEQRQSVIALNAKHFDPTESEIIEIAAQIEHNVTQFYSQVNKESSKLQNMLESYNIAQSWEQLLPWQDTGNFFLTWQFYYQMIKDPGWPPCYSITEVKQLPQFIQDELASRFKLEF